MTNFREGSTRLAFPSGTDFTSSGTTYLAPYTVGKLNASKQWVTVAATTDPAIGILYNCPDASGTVDVLSFNQSGTGKVVAGGTIALNALITFNSSGQAVAATQTTGGTQPSVLVFGRALEAAVSGQNFEFLSLSPFYY